MASRPPTVRATNGPSDRTHTRTLEQTQREVKTLREYSQDFYTLITDLANPNVIRRRLIVYMARCGDIVPQWTEISQLRDAYIDTFAMEQTDNRVTNFRQRVTDALNAANACRQWIFDNFPQAASTAWEVENYDQFGQRVDLYITVGSLTELATLVDLLIDALYLDPDQRP